MHSNMKYKQLFLDTLFVKFKKEIKYIVIVIKTCQTTFDKKPNFKKLSLFLSYSFYQFFRMFEHEDYHHSQHPSANVASYNQLYNT